MPLVERTNSGSFLYRLDPRTKLLLAALFTVLVFLIDVLPVAAGQMIIFTTVCLAGKIPLKKLFYHWKILVFLIALVLVLQAFLGSGLFTGLMISCRIIALTVLMPALTLSTDTRLLALGITRLGLNYQAAHIITATLNLIPTFEDEARLIIDARRLRGVQSLETGNPVRRLREYPPIALPLMIKAMRQAHMISLAMDTRAFGAYKTRTWLQEIKLSAADYFAFAAGILYAAIALTANYALR